MTFEKHHDLLSTFISRSGCSGCGQNNTTENQTKYGQQTQEHRSQTSSASASNCSC